MHQRMLRNLHVQLLQMLHVATAGVLTVWIIQRHDFHCVFEQETRSRKLANLLSMGRACSRCYSSKASDVIGCRCSQSPCIRTSN